MIGYGPDISDNKGSSNKHQDEESDFHPPPPPITKGSLSPLIPPLSLCHSLPLWLSL